MRKMDWVIAALLVVSWGWSFVQLERWHDLDKRAAVIKAQTEAVSEMCQSVARDIKALRP